MMPALPNMYLQNKQQMKMSLQPHYPQFNKRMTRGSSGFPVNTSGSNNGRTKRRKNTIYGTAKRGNIIDGLPGVRTRHLFIYGSRKETNADAIKTLLIENDITVFNAAVVSNELATYKSFKVTIPADQKAAACLPATGPKEYVSEISFIPLNKRIPIMEIKMGSYNCRGFNVSKIPAIKELLIDCDVC